MDIILLLPSCGWCVNHILCYFYSSFSFFFNFSGCNFKFSFSFSWVASLGIRVILPLVNCHLRNHDGILRAWYLVFLVSLKSLVQILRAVTLTVTKSRLGSSGMSRSLSGRSGGHFQVLEAQEGHFGVLPQFQYCRPSSGGTY